MRVLYVSKALVVAAYRDKCRELASRVELHSVVPERWGAEAVEDSPAGLPEPRRVAVALDGRNHLHFYPGAARWLAEERPDLVHIDEEPYSLVTWQLARLCRARGIPSLFFAWQNLARRLPPPFGALRSRVFRSVRGGVAGTEAAARVLRGAGFRGPLAVIPQFGVNPELFRPDLDHRHRVRRRLHLPGDGFVIGYGGRLLREKGVYVLLEAVARLSGGASEAPFLLMMGSGPEREALAARAESLGIGSRVRFTGQVLSSDVPSVLAAMDVLVLPSLGTATWSEQFGRILVEAMATGVPVVGSRTGEIPEVIGDAGDVVEADDVPALAARLAELRGDEALRAERARRGRERVLQRYTQARIAERTVAFYRELVALEGAA